LLGRSQALEHLLPYGPLLHPVHEFLDDPEVHICFQERQADFPGHLVDLLFGKLGVAAHALEDVLQAVAKVVEHISSPFSFRLLNIVTYPNPIPLSKRPGRVVGLPDSGNP
jgi:hypothetical protein